MRSLSPSSLVLTGLLFLASSTGYPLEFNGHRIGVENVSPSDGGARLVFLETPLISPAWKQEVSKTGAVLIGYVPPNAWLAWMPDGKSANRLLETRIVPGVHPLRPEMKIDPALQFDCEEPGLASLIVHLAPVKEEVFQSVIKKAVSLGCEPAGTVSRGRTLRAGFHVPREHIKAVAAALAGLEEVYLIEKGRGVKLLNDTAIHVLQSGTDTGPVSVWEQGVYGQGQVVAVCDTGLDADHCYFRESSGILPPANINGATTTDASRRKVLAVNFLYSGDNPSDPTRWDSQGHGTTVSGCAVGSHISSPTTDTLSNGLAPLARLIMQDGGYAGDDCSDLPGLGCPVIDLTPVFEQAYDQGARFHNNSWGDRENCIPHHTYTSRCRDIDEFTWTHRDFLGVFAAGNDGAVNGAVSSPGTAKNALSVGAIGKGVSYNLILPFSSTGFASDGRIKPDLCAPGRATAMSSDRNVTTANCNLETGNGTSFSSPYAAGCAALAACYLAEGYYPTGSPNPGHTIPAPPASLVKAMLINGCTDVVQAADIPAVSQGWGRILLDGVLYFPGDERKLWIHGEEIAFNSPLDEPYEIRVSTTAGPDLKVTLVWSDYPALVGVAPQLVNDLDLTVTGSSEVYLGNQFSGGFSVPGGSPDRLNNVEQVWIPNPGVDLYTITVAPHAIPEAGQSFSLVITGGFVTAEAANTVFWQMY